MLLDPASIADLHLLEAGGEVPKLLPLLSSSAECAELKELWKLAQLLLACDA